MSSSHSATRRLQHVQQHITACSASKESKFCSATEAVKLVSDDDRITIAGFVATGCPEELLNALRTRFDQTGTPRRLKLITPIAVGNGKGRGMDVLAKEGLLSEMIYAWAGTSPALLQMVHQSKMKAWNLPFGCISQMIRDCGASRVGPLTSIGSGTFVDPQEAGGKKNELTTEEIVRVVEIKGKRLLWYAAPEKINIAILRGSTADPDGNISFEREALLADSLQKAIAAHNSGGKVLVQVERTVSKDSIPAREVHIPGSLVDKIVVCSFPEFHLQTFKSLVYDPSLSGEKRVWLSDNTNMEMNERKVISHRAFMEITKSSSVVNLGVGMPEGVAKIAASYGSKLEFVMSTEAGAFGGYPQSGLAFGTAKNPITLLTSETMLDFYNGGGIDVAFLGMAEVDLHGNVNVSDFGNGRMPGCGGFIDISQSAKKVVFMGCLTTSGLKVSINNGSLKINKEGLYTKFKNHVKEKTFAAVSAGNREILYVTERAVFRLKPTGGLLLTELADGFHIKDIFSVMEFIPEVSPSLKIMDKAIFDVPSL